MCVRTPPTLGEYDNLIKLDVIDGMILSGIHYISQSHLKTSVTHLYMYIYLINLKYMCVYT